MAFSCRNGPQEVVLRDTEDWRELWRVKRPRGMGRVMATHFSPGDGEHLLLSAEASRPLGNRCWQAQTCRNAAPWQAQLALSSQMMNPHIAACKLMVKIAGEAVSSLRSLHTASLYKA
jgi:hypothetical protein